MDQKSVSVLQTDNVSEIVRKMMGTFSERVTTKMEVESDYVYNKMIHVDLLFVKWDPVRGLSYLPLPDYLKKLSRSIINIKNRDNMCLVYSILAILHPRKGKTKDHSERYWRFFSLLNLNGFDFESPPSVHSARSDIIRMEANNPSLSICCYIIDEDEKNINCFHISDRFKQDDPTLKEVNLLLIEKDFKYHFVGITHLKSLVTKLHTRSRVSQYKISLCRKCLNFQYSEKKAKEHLILCRNNEAQIISMPPPNTIYKFKDYHKCIPLSFSAYADMETYAVPILGCQPKPIDSCNLSYEWMLFEWEVEHVKSCQQCGPSGPCSVVRPLQTCSRHIPYAYGLKVQCFFPGYHDDFPLHIHYSDNEDELLNSFLLQLKTYCFQLYDTLHNAVPIIMTEENKKNHLEAEKCKYCERDFDDNCVKQADHDHITVCQRD